MRKEKLSIPKRRANYTEKMRVETFNEHFGSDMYNLWYRLFHHMVEDIQKSEVWSVLIINVFENVNFHIK